MRLCSLFFPAAPVWMLAMSLAAAPSDAASGSSFDLAQVIEAMMREIAAAERPRDAAAAGLRIDEVQVDLDLVEVSGKAGARLAVAGADFGTGKDDAPKAALKRRIVVDLSAPKEAKGGGSPARQGDGNSSGGAGGSLSRSIVELTSSLRAGVETAPGYDLKRAAIDLEFAIDRDAKALPVFVVFAGGRPLEARNVHKLKLKLSAKGQ